MRIEFHFCDRRCRAFASQQIPHHHPSVSRIPPFPVECVHLQIRRLTQYLSPYLRNKYPKFQDTFSPSFVPCSREGCGGICRFVLMSDGVDAFQQVTFTDSQCQPTAHHQRIHSLISLVARESSCSQHLLDCLVSDLS